jgi:LPXTG-site transpeptidase (sortase) family protein
MNDTRYEDAGRRDDPTARRRTMAARARRKRRRRNRIIVSILIPLGLLILLYPWLSDTWNRNRAERLKVDYDHAVSEIHDTKKEQILEEARAYNESLIGTQVPDAFMDRAVENDPEYENILNPAGNGLMGRVEVPCIHVDLPIYHFTDEAVLEKGAAHLPGSSVPIGGESTHSVIFAHRGLPSAKMFTDLDRVKIGNIFYLRVMDDTLAYEVDQILTVEPTETEPLSVVEGGDYCTLLTCTPYAVNSHRLLIRGHRVPYEEQVRQEEAEAAPPPQAESVFMRGLCVLAGIAIAAVAVFVVDRIGNRNRGRHRRR